LVASELTVASQTVHSSGTLSHQQEDEISSAIAAIGPGVKSVTIENNESVCKT
jgi:hypothetical protein